jgi:O-antigen ligase
MGFVLLAAGISIAAGFIFDKSMHSLLMLAAGVAFALGGLQLVGVQLLYNEKGRVSTLVGGLILAAFSYLCLYGAFSPDAHWSGGIPFIPQSWSQMLARTISGLFGAMCVAFTLRSLYLLVKPKHKNDHAA